MMKWSMFWWFIIIGSWWIPQCTFDKIAFFCFFFEQNTNIRLILDESKQILVVLSKYSWIHRWNGFTFKFWVFLDVESKAGGQETNGNGNGNGNGDFAAAKMIEFNSSEIDQSQELDSILFQVQIDSNQGTFFSQKKKG